MTFLLLSSFHDAVDTTDDRQTGEYEVAVGCKWAMGKLAFASFFDQRSTGRAENYEGDAHLSQGVCTALWSGRTNVTIFFSEFDCKNRSSLLFVNFKTFVWFKISLVFKILIFLNISIFCFKILRKQMDSFFDAFDRDQHGLLSLCDFMFGMVGTSPNTPHRTDSQQNH